MTRDDRTFERDRLAQLAMALIKRRGGEITPDMLAVEAGLSRHRLDAIFENEGDLFDTIAEQWYRPLMAIMEDVLGSNMPANRKMYEFFAQRFEVIRAVYRDDPVFFRTICDIGTRHFDRVRSYVDLADHYLCELIAQAQDEGHFKGLQIDEALSLINQMVVCYTVPDLLPMVDNRLSKDKLAAIVDTLFAGLSAADRGASGKASLRAA